MTQEAFQYIKLKVDSAIWTSIFLLDLLHSILCHTRQITNTVMNSVLPTSYCKKVNLTINTNSKKKQTQKQTQVNQNQPRITTWKVRSSAASIVTLASRSKPFLRHPKKAAEKNQQDFCRELKANLTFAFFLWLNGL